MISKISWADPRNFAASLKGEKNLVFLYSGTDVGKKSILAWNLERKANSTDDLAKSIKSNEKWFGFIGYGLKNQLEKLPQNADSYIELPDLYFANFKNVAVFDHEKKEVILSDNCEEIKALNYAPCSKTTVHGEINSNMTDNEYLQKVEHILECIKAGDLYQANLTRKFFGGFEDEPDSFDLFYELTNTSPAPYSSFIKFDDTAIISASPEKFLTIEEGIATTSPIKGTLGADKDPALLATSEKDKSENLMIVDLMRNDLSKTCTNVQTPELFKITTYKNYHHMHSTITGKCTTSALDVALGCFPPGSMTGAPKIQAMKLCTELEGMKRGVYSGAIGWFDGENNCDLSVVIRTLIVQGKKFEFQAGGAIVADSVPRKELEEVETKIAAIRKLLE